MAKGFINANTKIYADDVLNPHIYNAKGLAEDKAEINKRKAISGKLVSYTRNSESDSQYFQPETVIGCTTFMVYATSNTILDGMKLNIGTSVTRIADGEHSTQPAVVSSAVASSKTMVWYCNFTNGIVTLGVGSNTSKSVVQGASSTTEYPYIVYPPSKTNDFCISAIPVGATVSVYAC